MKITGAVANGQADVSSVMTDSRQSCAGALFVALRGERMDGHDYCAAAVRNGAVAVLIDRAVTVDVPSYRVTDTLEAYQQLGAAHRARFSVPCCAITGTNGKTTTKEICGTLLRAVGTPLVSHANHNNHIGVPENLLRWRKEHTHAVLELGMNHRGEIAVLTQLAAPTIGVITNIGRAHLAGVGTIADVAAAKMELWENMAPGGHAILPVEGPFVREMRRCADAQQLECVTFGVSRAADVCVETLRQTLTESHLRIHYAGETVECMVPISGRHNAHNVAAALAAALIAAPVEELAVYAAALSQVQPVSLRCAVEDIAGITCVIDCYNANPDSLRALLSWNGDVPCHGRVLAVLGDMNELGDTSEEHHYASGASVASAQVNTLIATGTYASAYAAGARDAGMAPEAIIQCRPEEVAATVNAHTQPGDRVLFKASRTLCFEESVATFRRIKTVCTV